MQKLSEYFDPYNPEHMDAWLVTEQTGALPVTFPPADVTIDLNWQIVVVAKMMRAWTDNYTGKSIVAW